MKASLGWLQDYVEIPVSIDELARRLTMAGLEVEGISSVAGDPVLELEITPNRPDCLHMIGLAREISAILNRPLKRPKPPRVRRPRAVTSISLLDKTACRRYVGVVLRGVRPGPSPEWLRRRLEAVGVRSINTVVDVTNFVLWETGQPLHAFDFDRLDGGRVVVRRARAGEPITTLDGKTRALDEEDLVIADSRRPVALAGVMGGDATEVTEETRTILIESAWFDPQTVRRTARRHGLITDSSYRFERGVDILGVEAAALRAAGLIQTLAEGSLMQYGEVYPHARRPGVRPFVVDGAEVADLLGAAVSPARVRIVLKRLGFIVRMEERGRLRIVPPSFRSDVRRVEDVAEEVGRILGYDHIPVSLPSVPLTNVPPAPAVSTRERLREVLVGQGLDEAVTFTLLGEEAASLGGRAADTRLWNPLTREQACMRPSLAPGLVQVLRTNWNRGRKDLAFFEVGKVYREGRETDAVGILLTGRRFEDWRTGGGRPVDFYDLKGVVESVCEAFRMPQARFRPRQDPMFLPSESAVVFEGPGGQAAWGVLGRLRSEVLRAAGVRCDRVYFAQFALDPLQRSGPVRPAYRPVCPYPAVVRDVSLSVPREVLFQEIRDALFAEGIPEMRRVVFREEYLGEKIPADRRGLVFSVVYRSDEGTLTDARVREIHEALERKLCERFRAVRR